MSKVLYSGAAILAMGALVLVFWEDLFVTPDRWVHRIPEAGSSSSPRPVDLTGDGVLDVVMGAGGDEYASTDHGVIALDGTDGSRLWSVPTRDQVVGSPVFNDLTGDGTPDVIIGGRSALLLAIDGRSGERIWTYLPTSDSLDLVRDRSILNFYTPQFIPDQDGDGRDDLLVAYGGFNSAPPDHTDRPPGRLMVVRSRDGKRLAEAEMPDGRETYMSPVVHDVDGDGTRSVFFGSGGETINGHFYRTSLDRVLEGDLSEATVLADGEGKGFVAPPVLADVTGDGVRDVVVNAVKGRILCFDGATNELIWEVDLGDDYEGYSVPAPGDFDGDGAPDFFVNYGHGTWPDMEFTSQFVIDGQEGTIAFEDTAGTFQYASPLTFDFTEDGRDDVLVVVNTEEAGGPPVGKYVNELRVFDPHTRKEYRFRDRKIGSNLGSTPLLTDLDGDGALDVIHSYVKEPARYFSFTSARIERMEPRIEVDASPRWGQYMGPQGAGVYRDRARGRPQTPEESP